MAHALDNRFGEATLVRLAPASPAPAPGFGAVLAIPHDNGPDRGRARRWTVSGGAVVVAYLALAGVACWRLANAPPIAPAPVEAMLVELAPAPRAPVAPPTERPVGPLQDVRDAAVAKAAPERSVSQQPPRPNGLETPPPEKPAPERGETSSRATPVVQSTAPPSLQAPPSPSVAARETSAAQERHAAVTWQGLLLGRLKQYRRYPRRAESARQEGVVHVRFTVDRRGAVLASRIDRSSGYPLLDDEVLATLQRANPMPPPPPEIKGDPVEVVVPVDFSLRKN